ncbi:lipooligosaccharide glycosyl transferase G [Haemophilus influenzae]|nr:hypothetical protein [Haemophilus influenzae]VEB27800.1 lipooligosaccharide glycosyl transferase G [Haemophilus influenzae]
MTKLITISLTCQKFQYGGGMERYLLDIVNGLSKTNITPKIYSAKFDTTLSEYNLINPIKINLSFVPKKCRASFLSYFSNKYKERSEISLTTYLTWLFVVVIIKDIYKHQRKSQAYQIDLKSWVNKNP